MSMSLPRGEHDAYVLGMTSEVHFLSHDAYVLGMTSEVRQHDCYDVQLVMQVSIEGKIVKIIAISTCM